MRYKIAVTGVGGGVGQGVLKALYGTGYELIALDGEPLATGLYAAPRSYLIPYADRPDYIPSLLKICKKEKVTLLFPGLDAELKQLSLNRNAFKAIGTRVIVSSPDVVEISDDKQRLHAFLKKIRVPTPLTIPLNEVSISQIKFPIIIKQMVGGARSKNVFLVRNKKEWGAVTAAIKENSGNFVAQEYIEGDEYTCGSVNLDNSCKGVIVMRRTLRDGDTYKCFTEKNSIIEGTVRRLLDAVKPFGACNVQLRVKDGKPYIFEINARCSGTTAARALAGFNEPKMIADYLIKGKEPLFDIKEISILRYWKELVVENSMISDLMKNSSLINIRSRPL
jgi:carbamoyl-phosphate synthase large subunit